MLILLNLIIVLLLLGMVAIWSTYGFFSALMHLVIVIASGAIAFAVWEPLAFWLLGRMPAYAHGVGLLAPFALLLILFRAVFDKLCRMNVHVPRLVDQIGGGVCGLISGILAFGLVLNGAGFLPIAKDAMGWEPYIIQGNTVVENEDSKLWGFTSVNKASASFFTTLSGGSMSAIGGASLADARPGLAKRAMVSRAAEDTHQMRSAHPDNVKVTGMYAVQANEEGLRSAIERSVVFHFLAPAYKLPEGVELGKDGKGLVDAVMEDLANRHADSEQFGRPSEMLNIAAILEAARTPELVFDNPTAEGNFEPFLEKVTDVMTQKLVDQMATVLSPEKQILFVDTHWKNDRPGTYHPKDNKLRVAIPQVELIVDDGDEMVSLPPVAYSVETSQNTKARTLTEIVSYQHYAAFAPYPDFHMGWAFMLPAAAEPVRLFVRELRFELGDLPGDETTRINTNPGAVARVVGMPPLPDPDAEDDGTGDPTNPSLTQGTAIAGTGAYADVSEDLPGAFAAAAASVELNRDTDPWSLMSGRSKDLPKGRGGNRSTIRSIWVPEGDRLIRVKLDGEGAKSLYGRARGLAESLNVMRVVDEGGNPAEAIGYALLRTNGSMNVDIRKDAFTRGLSASELPDVGRGETLYVYFQVQVDSTIVAYALGSNEQRFDEPLTVGAN